MTKKQINIKFYQNVAKVFYAIAKVDKVIRASEIITLKKIINQQWLALDTIEDNFDIDAAYQIEAVFDWLQSKDADVQSCFNEFLEYFEDHKCFFTKEIKSLILTTTDKIASTFAGKNKSELIFLANLNIVFKKTENLKK